MNYQEAIKGYTGIIQAYALADRTHESLTTDAWAVMVREIDNALKNGKDHSAIKGEMKAAEDAWKASTGVTVMPSTYRSAKAVALKAVAHKIPLLEADGAVRGKTAIEQAYKAVEAGSPEAAAKSTLGALQLLSRAVDKHWPKMSASDRAVFIAQVNSLRI